MNLTRITDEEIMGDYCQSCDYSLEGCLEHGQQSNCSSYKEALRQKKITAQKQLTHCQQQHEEVLREIKDAIYAEFGYAILSQEWEQFWQSYSPEKKPQEK